MSRESTLQDLQVLHNECNQNSQLFLFHAYGHAFLESLNIPRVYIAVYMLWKPFYISFMIYVNRLISRVWRTGSGENRSRKKAYSEPRNLSKISRTSDIIFDLHTINYLFLHCVTVPYDCSVLGLWELRISFLKNPKKSVCTVLRPKKRDSSLC